MWLGLAAMAEGIANIARAAVGAYAFNIGTEVQKVV